MAFIMRFASNPSPADGFRLCPRNPAGDSTPSPNMMPRGCRRWCRSGAPLRRLRDRPIPAGSGEASHWPDTTSSSPSDSMARNRRLAVRLRTLAEPCLQTPAATPCPTPGRPGLLGTTGYLGAPMCPCRARATWGSFFIRWFHCTRFEVVMLFTGLKAIVEIPMLSYDSVIGTITRPIHGCNKDAEEIDKKGGIVKLKSTPSRRITSRAMGRTGS